ncbi:MAG TPA: hypothetical protein VJ828_00850 [Lacipirellulaceae bacterium]|nr:hypothetical protein [Lacipirellulaceae bacterium]
MKRTKLSVPALAKMWGVGRQKVRELVLTGQLRAIDLSTRQNERPRYAIDISDVEEFERRRQVVPSKTMITRKIRRRPAGNVKPFF